MKNITIFVVTHKNLQNKITNKNYAYIGCRKGLDFEFTDNTLDNISEKNANFCELTAQYWIYKNCHSDYVGLVHYRRFFYKNPWSFLFKNVMDTNWAIRKLSKYDVILPEPLVLKKNIYDAYCKGHHKRDLDLTGEIIKNKYPEYYDSFLRLKKTNKYCCCNMIVTSKEVYDDYSEWLFNILFELEKKVDITEYDDYQKRVYGFLSERLLNVYFDYHDELRILHKPIFLIDENMKFIAKLRSFFKYYANKVKKIFYDLLFYGRLAITHKK